MMVLKNLDSVALTKIATASENCVATEEGALFSWTGEHTGRSPNAKLIVYDDISKDKVDWSNNNKIGVDQFDYLHARFLGYRNSLSNVYLQEVSAVKDPDYALTINVWTECAKHSMFARNMFVPYHHNDDRFKPIYNVYHFPLLP